MQTWPLALSRGPTLNFSGLFNSHYYSSFAHLFCTGHTRRLRWIILSFWNLEILESSRYVPIFISIQKTSAKFSTVFNHTGFFFLREPFKSLKTSASAFLNYLLDLRAWTDHTVFKQEQVIIRPSRNIRVTYSYFLVVLSRFNTIFSLHDTAWYSISSLAFTVSLAHLAIESLGTQNRDAYFPECRPTFSLLKSQVSPSWCEVDPFMKKRSIIMSWNRSFSARVWAEVKRHCRPHSPQQRNIHATPTENHNASSAYAMVSQKDTANDWTACLFDFRGWPFARSELALS
jgi:hypothetical protein